jgi:hypothetical protein
MSRESTAQLAIPSTGSESVPYATHREIVQGLLKHQTEKFAAQVLGAGGAGDSFVCPFEPAEIEVYVPATPLAQKSVPSDAGGATIAINLIDGTDAAGDPVVAAVDADDKSQGYTVTLPTGVLPDAAVGHVVCTGYRDTNGSL